VYTTYDLLNLKCVINFLEARGIHKLDQDKELLSKLKELHEMFNKQEIKEKNSQRCDAMIAEKRVALKMLSFLDWSWL
jgi:DUF1009 family protein